jgi:hypothetical protein
MAEELLRFSQLGVDHLVLDLHEGDELPSLAEAIDRFGREVLPALRAA